MKTGKMPAIRKSNCLAASKASSKTYPAPVLEHVFLQNPAVWGLHDCDAATFDVLAFLKSAEMSRLMKWRLVEDKVGF